MILHIKAICLSNKEKYFKGDFQDGSYGNHLGFPIGITWAIFDLQVAWYFLSRLESAGLSVQEKMHKNRFSRQRPWYTSCASDRNDFSYFWSTSCLKTTFQFPVNWLFCSEEAQSWFLRWRPWWPSWISDQNHFSYFWSTSHPDSFYQSTGLPVQKKLKINLKDGSHGSHLGLLIRTILAIFDLQVAPILPTKFRVSWPFDSGEEA